MRINLLHRYFQTYRQWEQDPNISLVLYPLAQSTHLFRILVISLIYLELNSVYIKENSKKVLINRFIKRKVEEFPPRVCNSIIYYTISSKLTGPFGLLIALFWKVEIKSIELLHTSFLEVTGKLCSPFNLTENSSLGSFRWSESVTRNLN